MSGDITSVSQDTNFYEPIPPPQRKKKKNAFSTGTATTGSSATWPNAEASSATELDAMKNFGVSLGSAGKSATQW